MTVIPALERISDYVSYYAEHAPERAALVLDDRVLTYRELAEAVDRCARALLASGVRKGDRVAMLSTPRPEFYVVYMATASIGGIWLGLNPRHRLDEYRYVIGDSAPKLFFAQLEIEGRSYTSDLAALRQEFEHIERLITFGGALDDRSTPFEDYLREAERVPPARYDAARAQVQPRDPALIVYTSGSTGRPKGALLTHRGIVTCRRIEAEHWHVANLRTVVNLPISHITGADEIPDYCLVAGGTLFFMERFDARATLELIERERLNYLLQFPTQFQLMVAVPEFERYDLSSLRCIVWCGAPASRDLLGRLSRIGARLATAWGQTETSGEITFTDEDADFESLVRTIGRTDPRYELRITDPDGTPLPPGEPGEIRVRGEILMGGYFGRPEATREAIDPDGWLHTSDIGIERADGNIELVGRLKEMYKSGGYNIYPREIEIVLESHPAVAMAAVVAVPDPLYQEIGHAFVETEAGASLAETELERHCRERLANYKVPKRFTVQAELPKLATGKIDKSALRERTRREAGRSREVEGAGPSSARGAAHAEGSRQPPR